MAAEPNNIPPAKPAIPAPIPVIPNAKLDAPFIPLIPSLLATPARVTTTPIPAAVSGVIAPKKLFNNLARAPPSNPPINVRP